MMHVVERVWAGLDEGVVPSLTSQRSPVPPVLIILALQLDELAYNHYYNNNIIVLMEGLVY
jgi:xanthosine utilization system XapX-like protein